MPRPSARTLFVLLAVLCLGGRGAAHAEEPVAHVAELLAATAEQREAAHARWWALPDAARARAAIAALQSDDAALARAGAVLVDPLWLDLGGLARLDAVLARDPLARMAPGEALDGVADERYAFGSANLPGIWRALVTAPVDVDVPHTALHRSLTHAHVADLVSLLATVPDARFDALFWDVMNQAQGEVDDTRHDLYVRAFRYAVLRLEARVQGLERPTFDAVMPMPAGAGIPADALALVRAAWVLPSPGFDDVRAPQAGNDRPQPGFWLSRWLRRIQPVGDDVERLLEIAQMAHAPMQARHWAGTWAARFEGRAAGRVFERILDGGKDDAGALAAAAEAAARGRPEAWSELGPYAWSILRWRAEPEKALELAWGALTKGELPEELEPDARTFGVYDLGLEIPGAALDELTERLRKGGAPAAAELAFFARVVPERMTVADAERVLARFEEQAERTAELDVSPPVEDLAALEVRAPAKLLEVLRRSVESGALGGDALELLMRLGDVTFVERIASELQDPNEHEARLVGRLRDPRMEAALRVALANPGAYEDTFSEEEAVEALALLHGLPEELVPLLEPATGAEEEDEAGARRRFERIRDLVVAGDPVGAVLLQATSGEVWDVDAFAGLGRLKDPRVHAQLAAWRTAPELGLRWPATAALALSGDAAARREWTLFLAEARTFLLDDVHASALFTLDGDPELVTAWIERLSENCCYAYHAGLALKHLFPTAPWEQTAGDGGRACWRARAWWKANRGHLAYSRLVDGWVPTAR